MARMRRRGGRRPGRKYARLRRRGYARRVLRSAVPVVHKFKEVAEWNRNTPGARGLTCAALSTNSGIMAFKLTDLQNFTSFQALFDLYKITGVKVRIIPNWSSGDVYGAQTNVAGFPMLYIAENRDPYVPAPVSNADILNDDGVKIIRVNKPVTMFLRNPKAEIKDADGSSLPFQFNSSKAMLQPWLTTGGNGQAIDQSALNHFGYRWYLDNTSSNTALSIQVFVTYYFSCKEQD